MNKISITIRSKIDGATVFDSADYSHIPAGIPVMDVIDDSLDSFTFTVKDILQRKPFQPFDLVTFTITDGESTDEFQYFVLNDNAKTYRNLDEDSYENPRSSYEHTIACVETTKYLEKIKVFELTMTNKHDTLLAQFEKAMNNIEPPIGVGYGGTVTGIGTRFTMTEALANLLENVEGCDFSFQNTDARTVFDEMLARVNARVVVHNVDFDSYGRYAITLGYHLLDVATDVVPIWELYGHGQIVHEEMGSDGQDYAGTIVARGYNSIPDEPLTVRVIPASSEAQLTDESATLFLPYPISSKGIKSVKMEVALGYVKKELGTPEYEGQPPYYVITGPYVIQGLCDLTNDIVSFEEFNLMSEEERRYKLNYQIGTKEISLAGSFNGRFGWTQLNLAGVIDKAVESFENEQHLLFCGCTQEDYNDRSCDFIRPVQILGGKSYFNYTFQIEYYPLLDTVASLQKTDETNLSLMAVMDSQTEQTLDISRHGKKLSGLLKRVGNDSYVVDVKAQKYSGLLSLLSRIDVDGEKYVLYKREYAVYNDFVNCRYYFSQNYTAVQENAGVNRERQIFPIPTEYNETPILIKKKLEFSCKREGDMVSGRGRCEAFSVDLAKSAMQTLIGANNIATEEEPTRGKLNYLFFKSTINNGNNDCPSQGKAYLLPLASYTLDNTMNFVASPLDNYSVAYSRTAYEFSIWGDGGRRTTYNPYVGDGTQDLSSIKEDSAWYIGEANSFFVSYAFNFPCLSKTEAVVAVPYSGEGQYSSPLVGYDVYIPNYREFRRPLHTEYPIISCGDIISVMSKDEYGEKFFAINYKKDRMQKPSFVLSLSVAVAEKDKGKLFVNPIFAKMNNLVRDNGDGATLYVWTKNSVFREGEEVVSLASIKRRQVKAVFDVIVDGFYAKLEPTIDPNRGKTYFENAFGLYQSSYQSWGICDSKGMVYLAVNGDVCPIALVCRD